MINTEEVIIEYLNKKLDGIQAYADIPFDRPEKFVVIEQTGGSGSIFRSESQLAISCFASTRYEACELAGIVHECLYDAADECKDIARVVLTLPYNFPLEELCRYQFSAQITTI